MRTSSRRAILRTGLAVSGGLVLASCTGDGTPGDHTMDESTVEGFVDPQGSRVTDAEAARNPGAVREFSLTAAPRDIDLGGVIARTWSYGDTIPGAALRVARGEQVKAVITNNLPNPTTIHWHGLALRCDMDGTPGVSQKPIESGADFTYQFTAPHAGTYWFHPHVGTQQDRGLYAPLIVDDPDEPLEYDEEWTVVLDDWMDGVTGTPDDVLKELSGGMGHGDMGHGDMDEPMAMGHMLMGATSDLLGGDAGDVAYPHFLVNGRVPADPDVLNAEPGTRVRIRIINAAGDTAFRVALAGHTMTVVHTDGFPIEPVETDALLLGMGERYDVIVELDDGVFGFVALAEGKNALGRALVRTGSGEPAKPDARPDELDRRVLAYSDLVPDPSVAFTPGEPDRVVDVELTGGMAEYDWGINGRRYDPNVLSGIEEGERVRLRFINNTTMWHPMHLHGHTFALADSGVRKDTAIVLPGSTLEVDFDADNPGRWMVHCHNVYHSESGMMTLIGYRD
ncbi:FtsP/CotA-like multicopper oxidase with cupredoxin domain [Stackebrandtia endophytica]|uniref:FtsP/CotA-like multicopper oxidase with cupredoxin domain n=1 Tax=Stackebrandtia endophytica TaxID=1496996 RepID=A0A543B3N0_9ACTN|nr:multicopper oxidase family protein [Stackebrandtia endophytica]TQL79370.1 FtsP/CotA-like multicopper oxidase with cupredoxin domain [Stackebrandtia endophytica]